MYVGLPIKVLLAAALLGAAASAAAADASSAPLELMQSIEIPGVPQGPYADHMAIDVNGHRLFATPQAARAVAVIDLESAKVVHVLTGFDNPHAVFFLADRHRLFVTDGGGSLQIIDSDGYRRIKRIPLAHNADGLAYDARTGLLYVSIGGDDVGLQDSRVILVDTRSEAAVGEIVLPTPALEAMIIDPARNRLYVDAPDENSILVIDLARRAVVENWHLKLARRNEAVALDAEHDRLFVGCNEGDVRGALVIVDTASGREIERLPLGSWVDSMFYDGKRGRLYASTGIGEIYSYERRTDGRWSVLEPTDSAVMARTSLFEPTLDRLFVMVPHLGWTRAKVLVFKPR